MQPTSCVKWHTTGEDALCPDPFTLAQTCRKKALQTTLDGYTYKPMSMTSETEYTDPKDMGEHTSPICSTRLLCLPLSISLSVPLTEHAGVIRLENDSKWHFTHARPCRPITQPQECAFLVCVTPLPHTSTYTHISSSITHRNTQTYVTNLKSFILTGATTVPVHLQPVLLRDIGHIASTVRCTRWERVSLKHHWKGLDFLAYFCLKLWQIKTTEACARMIPNTALRGCHSWMREVQFVSQRDRCVK